MTPNYQIKYTKEFKKSIKKITKQGKKIDKLLNVIDKLSKRVPLEIKYHDHALYIMIVVFKIAEIVISNLIGS